MPREENQVLVTKFYKPTDKTDCYFCYNPKTRNFEQRIIRLAGDNLVKTEFPTIVPLDSGFIFVLEATFDPNQVDEPKEKIIKISLIDTRIGL
jgi:hypothetical protein